MKSQYVVCRRSLASVMCILLATVLASCGDKRDAASSGKEGKSTDAGAKVASKDAPKPVAADPLAVTLTNELGALVRVGMPAQAEVSETLRIAGRLDVNGYKTARIGAPVTGRISDIKAVLGQQVRLGEVLADINSQELTGAQLSFLKAHSAEQLTTRAVERAELLLKSDVIGTAELQRRQNEQSVARAEKRAAADQLRVLGLGARAIQNLESTGKLIAAAPISATQSGTVIERKIAQGQVVQPSDVLFVVSDLNSIWGIAEVPEEEAQHVRRGQRVELEIPALGNQKRTGRIVYVADVVTPETRTVRVGVDLENPDRSLKPAMLITMLIEGKSASRLVVPAGAVVREGDADHVFVESSPGTLRLTKVALGPDRNGMRAILDKWPQGQRLVTDGAFHLNNERLKRNLEKKG